ncbi:MAG: hypothetical protein COB49_04400 [Alphaproteobacteria bacterium]|nr:MAG: hypothetical protein COB49_04400 [Alphaproteobacteria bacterium]
MRSYLSNFWLYYWAGKTWGKFACLVVGLILLISLFFGFLYYIAGPVENFSLLNLPGVSEKPFLPCFERAFITFVTKISRDVCVAGNTDFVRWIEYTEIIVSLFFLAALIAFFTAAILAPKQLLVFKTMLNIRRDSNDNKDCIYLSVYNGSSVTISKLHVRIIARVKLEHDLRQNVIIKDSPPTQPLAEPYIPLRFKGVLDDSRIHVTEIDQEGYVTRMKYKNLKGKEFDVEEIYVEVYGVISSVQQQTYTDHRYNIAQKELSYRSYDGSIKPDYLRARKGSAWQLRKPPNEVINKFHNDRGDILSLRTAIYIFGYGSLVDPESFRRTRNSDGPVPGDFRAVKLKGYQRIWNVAMDNSLRLQGYKYYIDLSTKAPVDGFVVFLNVIKNQPCENGASTGVFGALIPVKAEDLAKFDARERNYNRINVTTEIVDVPEGAIVYTYIGKPEACARYEAGKRLKKLFKSESYANKIIDAHNNLNEEAAKNYQLTICDKLITEKKLLVIKI